MGSADFLIYFSYSNYYIKNSAFWQRKIIVDLAVFARFLREEDLLGHFWHHALWGRVSLPNTVTYYD